MFKKKDEKPQIPTPPKAENEEIESPTIAAGTESQSIVDPNQDLLLLNYRQFKGFFERDVISLMSDQLGRFDRLEGKLDELIETIKKVSQ